MWSWPGWARGNHAALARVGLADEQPVLFADGRELNAWHIFLAYFLHGGGAKTSPWHIEGHFRSTALDTVVFSTLITP